MEVNKSPIDKMGPSVRDECPGIAPVAAPMKLEPGSPKRIASFEVHNEILGQLW